LVRQISIRNLSGKNFVSIKENKMLSSQKKFWYCQKKLWVFQKETADYKRLPFSILQLGKLLW